MVGGPTSAFLGGSKLGDPSARSECSVEESLDKPQKAPMPLVRSRFKQHSGLLYSWLLAAILPLFVVLPALSQPLEEHAHDAANLHIYRSIVFSAARADGWWFPVWVQSINAGLGGPLFSLYSPLEYYIIDGLHVLGLPHTLAYRVLTGLTLLAASTGAFGFALALGARVPGALAAAASYTYAFPLLHDLLERGSPQGIGVALYPWVLWGLVHFLLAPNGPRLALAALSWALILLSHNLSALFVLPAFALLSLILAWHRGWSVLWQATLVLVVGSALVAFSVFAFLDGQRYVQLDNLSRIEYARIADNPLLLSDLLRLAGAYDIGFDNNSMADRLGPLPGVVILISLAGGLLCLIRHRRRKTAFVISFALLGLTVLWLQTSSANWLWQAIPALSLVQFRARLLSLVSLSAAVVIALSVETLGRRRQWMVAAIVMLAAILPALPVLYPQLQHRYARFGSPITPSEVQVAALQNNVPGLTAFNEFLPKWRYQPFSQEEAQRVAALPLANLPAGGRILTDERRTGLLRTKIETPVPFVAAMHALYFPGWVARLDDQPLAVQPAEGTGYIQVAVPAGLHTIELSYAGTAAQQAGVLVSGATLLVLLLAAFLWRGRQGDGSPPVIYPSPRWWLPFGLVLLLGLKTLWLDSHTTLFRLNSSCQAIYGTTVQTNVRFDGGPRLCGYSLNSSHFRPGESLRITLYWQAGLPPTEAAESFVQFLGTTFNPQTNNPLWGQRNKQLPGGHLLTGWVPGKLYRDVYEFQIAPHTPAGDYELEVGWRLPSTEQRLQPHLMQAGDRLSVSHLDSLLISGFVVK